MLVMNEDHRKSFSHHGARKVPTAGPTSSIFESKGSPVTGQLILDAGSSPRRMYSLIVSAVQFDLTEVMPC